MKCSILRKNVKMCTSLSNFAQKLLNRKTFLILFRNFQRHVGSRLNIDFILARFNERAIYLSFKISESHIASECHRLCTSVCVYEWWNLIHLRAVLALFLYSYIQWKVLNNLMHTHTHMKKFNRLLKKLFIVSIFLPVNTFENGSYRVCMRLITV